MKRFEDIDIKDNKDGTCIIKNIHGFSLDKTLRSGQCFRFKCINNIFIVQSKDKVIGITQDCLNDDTLLVLGDIKDVEEYWINYFNIADNYTDIDKLVIGNGYLERAARYSSGLKIMKQDAWETLICFIISQRNNIPKIMTTVNKICELCGEEIDFNNKKYYSFPTPERLLSGIKEYGNDMGLGYRLPYIGYATRKVIDKEIELDKLDYKNSSYENTMNVLETLYGVGPKVANCTALFGLGHTSAFPVDVWIQRIIDKEFNGCFEAKQFGEYAGIIQQYMFYYGRSSGR